MGECLVTLRVCEKGAGKGCSMINSMSGLSI